MKKDSWTKYLAWLIHPMALGFVITMVLVSLTIRYYDMAGSSIDLNQERGVTGFLYQLHQKSIDWRLRWRGPRPVSKNLALLAVDERAVATIGRWPWPREVVAKAVDNAFKYGAKLVAFDIVFSEPQLNPVQQVYDRMKAKGNLNPEMAKTLESYSDQLDSDKALGAVFAKYGEKIIAGSFYNNPFPINPAPEIDFCHDLIFKRSAAAKQWDKEEVLLAANDPYLPYMPQALTDVFSSVLDTKEKTVREALGTPHNRTEEVNQNIEVEKELNDSCDSILDDFRDVLNQQWKTLVAKENPKQFKFQSYDAWLADYRAKSKPNAVPMAVDWVLDTPTIAQGSKHTGFFNTVPDSDGTIRSKPLLVRSGNSYFPSLSLKAFLVANNYNATPKLQYNPATAQKDVADLEVTSNDTGDVVMHIPTDRHGKLLVNYAGQQKMYPHMSFADLLSDSPDAEITQRVYNPKDKLWEEKSVKVKKADFIKDKIFFAGATAIGIYDLRVTPFEENFPGTETHLNAVDNMMQRNFFHTVPDEAVYMPIVLTVIGLLLSVALSFLGAVPNLLLTALMLIGVILYDEHFLFNKGIVVSIIWPVFLIAALYTGLIFYRYLTEERGKKELRQTFQKYVSPAIVEEILAHPANIELGGRKANLTVFFSDVRGFTTISEKLDPKALSDLLNSYLTPMTEIVFKNKGTLDKYMGDAIMAFFGAPIGIPDHAKWACRCALQSLDKLHDLQKEYEKKGLPTIDIGIGLNTGEVNVGNMGSQTVRSYTVMGDAVNLASRLEGINKQYGTRIILSEFTHEAVKSNFVCREVDWVRVKGKVLPVKIYELLAEEKVKSTVAEMLKWFGEGYQHYHNKAWTEGLAAFNRALNIVPDDQVAKLYIERCQDYITEPPADGWDGVFVMKTK